MLRANMAWKSASRTAWASRKASVWEILRPSRIHPRWSPDSKKIAYTDKRLNVWYVDLEKKTPVRIDADTYAGPAALDPAWSPDSKWIAYTKQLKSHLHAVFVYSLEQGKTFQLTDGMSDARTRRSTRTASISTSRPARTPLEHRLARYVEHPALRHAQRLCRGAGQGSAARRSRRKATKRKPAIKGRQEDRADKKPKRRRKERNREFTIDFDNIGQRILALADSGAELYRHVAG